MKLFQKHSLYIPGQNPHFLVHSHMVWKVLHTLKQDYIAYIHWGTLVSLRWTRKFEILPLCIFLDKCILSPPSPNRTSANP